MRIRCPFCGDRDHAEFAYLGDAGPTRPQASGPGGVPESAQFIDYVYMRTNPAGVLQEYWQHVGGCRTWLVVKRDITTHAIEAVSIARDHALLRSGTEPWLAD